MSTKTQLLIGLILLGVVDIVIPVPIIGLILIYVVLDTPPWFMHYVREIYTAE